MQTALIGYPELRKRLEAAGKPVIVLPQLQEVRDLRGAPPDDRMLIATLSHKCNDLPCDTGSVRCLCRPDSTAPID